MSGVTITLLAWALLLSGAAGASPVPAPKAIKAAEQQIGKRQYKQALKTLGGVRTEGKLEALRLFHSARAHAGLKAWAEAEAANEQAVKVDPTLLEAPYNNACYAARAGALDRAFHWLEVVADALGARGEAFRRERFRALMAKDPDMAPLKRDARYPPLAKRIAEGDLRDAAKKLAAMPAAEGAKAQAKRHGLVFDDADGLSFEVEHEGGSTVLPVLRSDTTETKTGEIDARSFALVDAGKRLSLHELLAQRSLLKAEGGERAIVSTQASFLPVPRTGRGGLLAARGTEPMTALLATPEGTRAMTEAKVPLASPVDTLVLIRVQPDLPVRVTVYHLRATASGAVEEADFKDLAARAKDLGRSVVGVEPGKPGDYAGAKVQSNEWWEDVLQRYARLRGVKRDEVHWKLEELLGASYRGKPATELYVRAVLGARWKGKGE